MSRENGLEVGQSAGKVGLKTPVNGGDPKRTRHRESSALSALLTIEDVAAECRVSYWTARGWIESGKLPRVKLPGDRLIRVRRHDFERFLEGLR